ncbi:MAG: PKD domain-containing protein [Bacteroidota bacterium]
MKKFLSCLVCCAFSLSLLPLQAQLAPNQPQQDCINAIPICDTIYYEPVSYQGKGLNATEIDSVGSCLDRGERNGAWYMIHVLGAGNICFTITPDNPAQDLDFSVFNLTNATCADIKLDSSLEVRCNFITNIGPCNGITGADGEINGLCGFQHTSCIPAEIGETFLLYVSSYNVFQEGYTIDFGKSTAKLFDNNDIEATAVMDMPTLDEITVTFSKPVECFRVSNATFGFVGSPTNRTIQVVSSDDCQVGSRYDTDFLLKIQPAISMDELGNIQLAIQDTVFEMCGKSLINVNFPITIDFDINRTPSGDTLCSNELVELSTNIPNPGSVIINWGPNPDTGATWQLSPEDGVVYEANVFGLNGTPIGSNSTSIPVLGSPDIALGKDTTICSTRAIELSVPSGYNTYMWSNGDMDTLTQVIQAGIYWVEVEGINGCKTRDSIEISVLDPPVADFTFANNGLTLNFDGQCSECATYQWLFGDGTTSNQPSPNHSFTAAGTYQVTLTVTNKCGTDTYSELILVGPDAIESPLIGKYMVFPNPASSQLFVKAELESSLEAKVSLINTLGKTIDQKNLPTRQQISFDVAQLPAGIYLLEIKTEDGILSQKIVVTK